MRVSSSAACSQNQRIVAHGGAVAVGIAIYCKDLSIHLAFILPGPECSGGAEFRGYKMDKQLHDATDHLRMMDLRIEMQREKIARLSRAEADVSQAAKTLELLQNTKQEWRGNSLC